MSAFIPALPIIPQNNVLTKSSFINEFRFDEEDEDEDEDGERGSGTHSFYNDRNTTWSTPSIDSLSDLRNKNVNGTKWDIFQIKMTGRDRGQYLTLFNQAILATFFEWTDGKPLRSEEWPCVITNLYEKIFEQNADNMHAKLIAAVSSWFSFL